MKKIVLLISLFFLSSCAALQNYQDRSLACDGFARDFKHDQKWVDSCMSDDAVFSSAVKGMLKAMKPGDLCHVGFVNNGSAIGQDAENIARSRKINCSPYYSQWAANVEKEDVMGLCALWYKGTGPKELRDAVRKEVKNRSVDCPAMFSVIAAQQQAAAQNAQAAAMINANIQNSINANRPRTCYSYGASVTCY